MIEVLVALFVLALMAGMAWQGVDMVMRSREVSQARMERLLRVQSVLTQWEADLRQLVDTQVVPALSFDGANLRLTRLQAEGVQLVTWSLRGSTLTRWAAPVTRRSEALQEAWMRSHQLLGSESGTLAALDGVGQVQLYYFDLSSSAWRNAQSSGDLEAGEAAPTQATDPKPASGREALPDGVRMVLGLTGQDGRGESGTITRDLRLVHP
jgi:general secretion pathway protein J